MRTIRNRGAMDESNDFQRDETVGPGQYRIAKRDNGFMLAGKTCPKCGHHFAIAPRECRQCGAELIDATFGPRGEVWSSTVVHIKAAMRTAPYTLAYVDLLQGPRIIAHVRDASVRPNVGQLAELVGLTESGDPMVVCV